MPYSRPLICRKCGKALTNENYGKYAIQRRTHWRICNDCFFEWYRNWNKTSPAAKAKRERQRQYARANYIGYSDERFGRRYIKVVGKRPYSSNCELYGRETKTVYHHWDNSDFSKGLWLCVYCHNIAEGVEDGRVQKYLVLKKQIEGVQTK